MLSADGRVRSEERHSFTATRISFGMDGRSVMQLSITRILQETKVSNSSFNAASLDVEWKDLKEESNSARKLRVRDEMYRRVVMRRRRMWLTVET